MRNNRLSLTYLGLIVFILSVNRRLHWLLLGVSFPTLNCNEAVCLRWVFDALEEVRLVVKSHLFTFKVLTVALLQFIDLKCHLILLFVKRHQMVFIDLADWFPEGARLALIRLGWNVKLWLSHRQIDRLVSVLLLSVEEVILHKRVLFCISSRA